MAQAVCYSACGADLILGSAMQATFAGNSAVLVSCVNGKLLELLGETRSVHTSGVSTGVVWENTGAKKRGSIHIEAKN